MVYSGYVLIYGIQLDKSNIFSFLSKFLDIRDIQDLDMDAINEYLIKNGFEFKLYTKRCCNDDGTIYLGFILGETDFVYRDEVREYATFMEYHAAMLTQLNAIMEHYNHNKTMIDDEFMCMRELAKQRNSDTLDEFLCLCDDIRFFTFANDCERCS